VPRLSLTVRALVGVLALVLASPDGAEARRQREFAYGFEQTWNAALRLLRVDLRMPVTDRDQEGGYVMFDYVSAGKRHPGSVELVAQPAASRAATVVVVQVPGMPSYVEQMLLDRLGKKLLAEYGPPPKAPPPAAPPPPPAESDAGSEPPKAESE